MLYWSKIIYLLQFTSPLPLKNLCSSNYGTTVPLTGFITTTHTNDSRSSVHCRNALACLAIPVIPRGNNYYLQKQKKKDF